MVITAAATPTPSPSPIAPFVHVGSASGVTSSGVVIAALIAGSFLSLTTYLTIRSNREANRNTLNKTDETTKATLATQIKISESTLAEQRRQSEAGLRAQMQAATEERLWERRAETYVQAMDLLRTVNVAFAFAVATGATQTRHQKYEAELHRMAALHSAVRTFASQQVDRAWVDWSTHVNLGARSVIELLLASPPTPARPQQAERDNERIDAARKRLVELGDALAEAMREDLRSHRDGGLTAS
jgi:hypothetical protein